MPGGDWTSFINLHYGYICRVEIELTLLTYIMATYMPGGDWTSFINLHYGYICRVEIELALLTYIMAIDVGWRLN